MFKIKMTCHFTRCTYNKCQEHVCQLDSNEIYIDRDGFCSEMREDFGDE